MKRPGEEETTTPLLVLLGLATQVPPPVGQKLTCTEAPLVGAQKFVPRMVTVLPPVIDPLVTEPESPTTLGVGSVGVLYEKTDE